MEPVSFGRYTLLHRIARGGMAEIYLARSETAVARLLVIKLVSGHYSEDESFATMFEDEVRIASTLSHPNIGQVIDVGQVGGAYYLAMEHIHGQDLRAILKRRLERGQAVPVAIAVPIAIKIASALQHAHEACGLDGKPLGIVHRDVSPSNVMVTYDGQVKLIDFGIAKAENRLTLTMPGTIKGKLRYLAPEQVMAQAVDARSDIFTLGVTLWEATIGEHLFDGPAEAQIYEAIVRGRVRLPSAVQPDYPRGLEQILARALATRPEDRYPSARELQRALEQFALEARIPLSDLEIARFMHETFAAEIAVFEEAQRSGGGLVEGFRKLSPDDGSRPARLPEEGSGRSDSAIAGAGRIAPQAVVAPEPPRKTILYGDLQAPMAFAPQPAKPLAPGPTLADRPPAGGAPTGPANPVLVTRDGQIRTGPLPQLDSDPGGRRATVIVDDARPTSVSGPPAALAGPQAREQRVLIVTQAALLESKTAVEDVLGDARPTLIASAEPPVAGPSTPASTGPIPMPIPDSSTPRVDPASAPEPLIGRDRRDLEEKRRLARAGPAEERPPAKTGDWAYQQSGENRPGTHPYFREEVSPPAGARRGSSRLALVLSLVAVAAGGAGLGLWFLLGSRGGGRAATPDAGEPATRRMELESDPSGATVRDTATGKVLGKTPLVLALKAGERLTVELALADHERRSVVLQPDTGRRKVYLVPEQHPAPTVAPDARTAAGERADAAAPDLRTPRPKPKPKLRPPPERSRPEPKVEAKPTPKPKLKRPGDIIDPFQ